VKLTETKIGFTVRVSDAGGVSHFMDFVKEPEAFGGGGGGGSWRLKLRYLSGVDNEDNDARL